MFHSKSKEKQEGVPVGCVPLACRPYVWWLPPLGVSSRGGYPLPRHTHLLDIPNAIFSDRCINLYLQQVQVELEKLRLQNRLRLVGQMALQMS